MNVDTKLRRNEDVLVTEVGETLLMMSVDTGNYHELDEIGAAVWAELESPKTVAELRDELCKNFEVTPEKCEADLLPFLEQMSEFRLVDEC